jgi:hypothetical protein
MSETSAEVSLSDEINNLSVLSLGGDSAVTVAPGEHRLVELIKSDFNGQSVWVKSEQSNLNTQLDIANFSYRNGIGIPEPATVGLLAVGLGLVGCGRRRRAEVS